MQSFAEAVVFLALVLIPLMAETTRPGRENVADATRHNAGGSRPATVR